jgi:two-component system, NarL family, sensor kinase
MEQRKARTTTRRALAKDPSGLTIASQDAETESLLRSTLDGLSAHIAVLDRRGAIVTVNNAWRTFADQCGYTDPNHGVGSNYLAVCERAASFSEDAAQTAKALRDILSGRRHDFRLEYPCTGPDGLRWFQLRITGPIHDQVQRVVIAHEDITEVKRANAQLAQLTGRLMQLQDDERRAIARELHDTTAQNLLAVTLNVTRVRERLKHGVSPTDRVLAETLELAEQSLQEVRTLSYLLHPPSLDVVGLGSALKWLGKGFSERSGLSVETRIHPGLDNLPQDAATALFRVAQECLANVHRHSGSTWARLSFERRDGMAQLAVVDGGCGMPGRPEEQKSVGVGLSGMRIRLEQLGGKLDVTSDPGGTRVTACIPLNDAAESVR